mgnify:CR=1 FL=1
MPPNTKILLENLADSHSVRWRGIYTGLGLPVTHEFPSAESIRRETALGRELEFTPSVLHRDNKLVIGARYEGGKNLMSI